MELPAALFANPEFSRIDAIKNANFWDTATVHQLFEALPQTEQQSLRSTERGLEQAGFLPSSLSASDLQDSAGLAPNALVLENFTAQAKRKRTTVLYAQSMQHANSPETSAMLFANDARGGRRWVYLDESGQEEEAFASLDVHSRALIRALVRLAAGKNLLVWPQGPLVAQLRAISSALGTNQLRTKDGSQIMLGGFVYQPAATMTLGYASDGAAENNSPNNSTSTALRPAPRGQQVLSHLEQLEAQSIHIMREVVAQAENPVMLYSVGKDSSAMLHLAKKAFYPSPPPFPLLHVDTRWKFQAMYRFRDEIAKSLGMELLVHINPEGVEKDINPFDHGSALHTDVMKTQGLKAALDKYGFDVAFGGARRDEEKSRAKERVFSFRSSSHRWDPKNQRPELWNLYNATINPGESIRVFPLSNWTELDIWQYLYQEQVPLVPLYFSEERPVVERDGMITLVDDERMRLFENENIELKQVRFRTLGCYPLTGAVESTADDLPSIILELLQSRSSERQGRAIDNDSNASMEKKKQEGYF